ncbi:MAG: hypothetical protein AB1486_19805 [Planctomycetota bacterium]
MAMCVVEPEGLLEDAEDHRATLEALVGPILLQGRNGFPGKFTFERTQGPGHSSQHFEVDLRGARVRYESHLLARDGLGYLILMWGQPSQVEDIKGCCAAVVESFRFPGPETEWGKAAESRSHQVSVRGYTIRLAYQESLLKPNTDRRDALVSLSTSDEKLNYFILAAEGLADADTHLDNVLRVLTRTWPELAEVERGDVLLAGRPARRLTTENAAEDPLNFETYAVLLEPQLLLDVRIGVNGPIERRRELIDRFLQSIEITEPPHLDPFPRVEKPTPAPYLNSCEAELLRASTLLGKLTDSDTYTVLSDGALLGAHETGVEILRPGEDESETLFTDENFRTRSAVSAADSIYVCASDGDVWRATGGAAEPAGFRARRIAPGPRGGLLLVRRAVPREIPGFGFLSPGEDDALLLRDADGREEKLGSFPPSRVDHVQMDGTGRTVLVVLSRPAGSMERAPIRMRVLELGSSECVELASWQQVDHLGAAPDGWVVTGRPDDGPTGIYRAQADGSHQLLISGPDVTGVMIAGDELVFTSQKRLPGVALGTGNVLAYRVPLAAIRDVGPRCAPFHDRLLQDIAQATLSALAIDQTDPACFRDRAAVGKFCATADTIARQRCGVGLPTDPAEVDALLGAFAPAAGGQRPQSESVLLLMAVFSECLLQNGAEWVAEWVEGSQSSLGNLALHGIEAHETPFVVASLPAEVVLSTLYEEEGWWKPATWLLEQMQGRRLLLGTDPFALRRAVEGASEVDIGALCSVPDVEGIERLLEESPGNVYLRVTVYDRLAEAGHTVQLRTIAEPWARREPPQTDDVRAFCAAQLELAPDAASCAAMVDMLKEAIRRAPDMAALYVLLGRAYELSDREDGTQMARACYQHVIDVFDSGAPERDAERGLERLRQ